MIRRSVDQDFIRLTIEIIHMQIFSLAHIEEVATRPPSVQYFTAAVVTLKTSLRIIHVSTFATPRLGGKPLWRNTILRILRSGRMLLLGNIPRPMVCVLICK